ncbi:glycoside hydrolase family 31 protein [Pedobacter sp. UBA4863]|uniref:glycoside hydrolase family 31 protein n=1 Tax=Pedobacter sp. UBA4863 TaxID=1947060 RepID=UPI0025FB197D|nr:glycoside hydrolase family 31 protein [Pedobacter sp. UBA4863]
MKKILFILLLLTIKIQYAASATENNPVADPAAIVLSGNMRFTVLTPEILRIEWSSKQNFEDRASFTFLNRKLPVPVFKTERKDGFLYVRTNKLTLQYRIGSFPEASNPQNLKITFQMNGQVQTWFPGKKDSLNLKGTTRTLDGSDGDNKRSEMEEGIISSSGWALIDETKQRGDGSISLMLEKDDEIDWVAQRKDKEAIDWYFFGYGTDYKTALKDFTTIAGKIPMPPMYAFGYWYSKYEQYNEQDFKDLVNVMQEKQVPIDVMVVDMDWHYSGNKTDNNRGGWTGWTWNKRLFPDPPGFLKWLHDHNLKTTLNLHPADGVAPDETNFAALASELGLPKDTTVALNIENKSFYQSFFKNILRPHENIGVDFWWLDWQQWPLARNEEKLGNTFWLNHVFYNDMKLQKRGRPMIFHRLGGLGNHRYQIGFSGDSHANFSTLAFQPYFTATASNVGYGYWSHDIGGHYQDGDNNPELFLRWIQYGVFSPVLRTHSTNNPKIERRMWKYPNFSLMKEALELRYSMVPYIYTQARLAYDTGISLCRPLYYEFADVNEAYTYENEYMFGNDILVAPITEASDENGINKKTIWLPKGKWYEVNSGTMLEGNQTYARTFKQNDIPHYYREGAIIPHFPKVLHLKNRPDKLLLKITPGKSGQLMYYEDENDNDNYQTGAYTFTRIIQEVSKGNGTYTIHPVSGSFVNMPTERAYDLELLSVSLPKKVTVNGKTYPQSDNENVGTWKYDHVTKTAKVYIPKTSCKQKTEINIRFYK